jgi:CRISPR-associated protein Cas5d
MCLTKNSFEFEVWSRYALFTDPITKIGGEKYSYHIPTYEALKGITKSIYWKPTIIWIIDKVRIMHQIRTESKGTLLIDYNDTTKNGLAYYTFLYDVKYQVKVRYVWNTKHQDLINDFNQKKHTAIFKRSLDRGGRQDIYLGTRECQGYVKPCKFGSGKSHYDNAGSLTYGLMFHSFEYPDEVDTKTLNSLFWCPTTENGVISFVKQEDCKVRRKLKPMKAKIFEFNKNFNSVDDEFSEMEPEL